MKALVTGASCGLGKALCEALATRGIPLLLVARREDKLKEVAKTLSVPTEIYSVDLTHPQERQKFLEWLKVQAPDLIINNAGSGLYGPALSHTTAEQSQHVELNVQALLEITLEGARALLEQKKPGVIMNISSAAAFFLYPSHCIYAAAKKFVNQFSESLDFELKPQGIRILTCCPGQIDTEFSIRASGGMPHKKSALWTMSSEKAARLILQQIDKRKPLEIIDFRYKCFVSLGKILPKALILRIMNTTLKDRYSFK
jgi:uncharacterized protein